MSSENILNGNTGKITKKLIGFRRLVSVYLHIAGYLAEYFTVVWLLKNQVRA